MSETTPAMRPPAEAESVGRWRVVLLAAAAAASFALLGVAQREVRSGMALLDYLAEAGWSGLAAVGDAGFRKLFHFDAIALNAAAWGLTALLLPVAAVTMARRRRPEVDRRQALARLYPAFWPGALSAVIGLHLVGFRAPFFTADPPFDDYKKLWQIALVGLVAWSAARLAGRAATLFASPESGLEAPGGADAERRPPPRSRWMSAMLLLAALYSVVFGAMTVLRHLAYNSATHDLGLYDQMVWSLANGYGFRVSIWDLIVPHNYNFLAEHAMPVMLLFAPLYRLAASPQMLLVAQCGALAGAAVFLFLFARGVLRSDCVAFALGASFLLHPVIQEANLKDFHADALEPLCVFLALWAWHRRRLFCFVLGAALYLVCKEDTGLTLATLGIFLLLRRDWRYGGLALAMGLAYYSGITRFVILPARDGEPLRHLYRYTHLAFPTLTDAQLAAGAPIAGLGQLARGFFLHPIAALTPEVRMRGAYPAILTHERIRSLLVLFVPVGFAFLRAPRAWVLPAIPIAAAMLSNWDHNYRLRMHYGIAGMTWVYAASVIGLAGWLGAPGKSVDDVDEMDDVDKPSAVEGERAAATRRRQIRCMAWTVYLLVAGGSLAYYFGRMPGMKEFDVTTYQRDAGARRTDRVLEEIGPDDSVSASNNIGPHITRRRDAMMFPVIDIVRPDGTTERADWVLVDTRAHPWPLDTDDYRRAVEDLLRGGEYGVWKTGYEEGILLLRRGYSNTLNAEVLARLDFPRM